MVGGVAAKIVNLLLDSTTILTEAEFESLLARKKFDPYWKKIAFIQNYRGISVFIVGILRDLFE